MIFFLHNEKEKENGKEMDIEMNTSNITTEINLITSSPVTTFLFLILQKLMMI